MLRAATSSVWSASSEIQLGGRRMKKILVVIAILVAAAACGGAAGSSTTAGGPATSYGPAQSNGSTGSPTKISGQPDNAANPGTPSKTTVPALQGPPVIRQAQLTLTVGSGSFESKLNEVRTLVEGNGGYIAGTDASVQPADSQIRTGVLNFMLPAATVDATIDQLSQVGKDQHEQFTATDT